MSDDDDEFIDEIARSFNNGKPFYKIQIEKLQAQQSEIETLKKQNKSLDDKRLLSGQKNKKLSDENEELRASLRKVKELQIVEVLRVLEE